MKDDPNLKARMLWFHIWGIPSLHSCLELFECRCMKKPGQMQWHGWQLRFAGGWVGCVSSWTDQAALHLHTHGVLKSFLDEGILLLLLRLWCMPDRKFGWLVVLFFSFESRIVWFHIVTAFAQLSHVFFFEIKEPSCVGNSCWPRGSGNIGIYRFA